jgi:hypothetical protein
MDALTFSSVSTAGQNLLQGTIPPEWYGNNQLLKEFLSSFSTPESRSAAEQNTNEHY